MVSELFLSIEFARTKVGIVMNQRKYTSKLILELGLGGSKPACSPLDANQRLTSIEFDKAVNDPDKDDSDKPLTDINKYQRLVGRLLYLTMTRVDISFAVQVLSQFMHAPKVSHMEAALRVVRYINCSPGLGLFMPSQSNHLLTAYCDSDWGTCPQTRRFVTGYLVKFGDALVS
ncbi:uncharacterized mitochondrial protein AtMg00810-like [Lycium barbarum]|uniref:uncharacterized mitochondrial protein AtMg00810-like n=1 Tax=Lycium barbarum TaxID=112863 RepID=UPI00293E03B6|nr:uncharacterized mitochondrial protein AtMg00810-like [Lycium barbarum]